MPPTRVSFVTKFAVMSMEVRALEPKEVWNMFADLNAVPRPSKKEERVIQFMLDFGNRLGLETFSDEVGNVIIRKPGVGDLAKKKMVTMQSHLDMVHQKNTSTIFDFDTQGIEMYVDEDWVRAKGTTLGADNGMGVATIMALLASETIAHPPLEALFTIDEETGMTGAMGLKAGVLQGSTLLNLDTEEDDEIDIGCAGGIDITATRNFTVTAVPEDHVGLQVVLNGLQGGHSGMDIHRGYGNANKLMNRILYAVQQRFLMQLVTIHGGSLRNAIPRESVATFTVAKADVVAVKDAIETLSETLKNEYLEIEKQLAISITDVEAPSFAMEANAQAQLIKAVYAAHNGVYAMSASIPDLVETSNNVAKIVVENGTATVSCLTRSSVDTAKQDLANALEATFSLAGLDVVASGAYPGWAPNPNSEILTVLKDQYVKVFNETPKVVACHAGLECGILGQHYPTMDMISFGPTIKGAHSPDERVSISSVQKFWKFTLEVLKHTP